MVFDSEVSTDNGVGVVHGDQTTGRICYVAELRDAQCKEKGKGVEEFLCLRYAENWRLTPGPGSRRSSQFLKDLDSRGNSYEEKVKDNQVSLAELTIDVPIHDNDDSIMIKVGSQLSPQMRQKLVNFLRANLNVFVWTHSDMCENSPDIASHALNIDAWHVLVKQKRRISSTNSTSGDTSHFVEAG